MSCWNPLSRGSNKSQGFSMCDKYCEVWRWSSKATMLHAKKLWQRRAICGRLVSWYDLRLQDLVSVSGSHQCTCHMCKVCYVRWWVPVAPGHFRYQHDRPPEHNFERNVHQDKGTSCSTREKKNRTHGCIYIIYIYEARLIDYHILSWLFKSCNP